MKEQRHVKKNVLYWKVTLHTFCQELLFCALFSQHGTRQIRAFFIRKFLAREIFLSGQFSFFLPLTFLCIRVWARFSTLAYCGTSVDHSYKADNLEVKRNQRRRVRVTSVCIFLKLGTPGCSVFLAVILFHSWTLFAFHHSHPYWGCLTVNCLVPIFFYFIFWRILKTGLESKFKSENDYLTWPNILP